MQTIRVALDALIHHVQTGRNPGYLDVLSIKARAVECACAVEVKAIGFALVRTPIPVENPAVDALVKEMMSRESAVTSGHVRALAINEIAHYAKALQDLCIDLIDDYDQ